MARFLKDEKTPIQKTRYSRSRHKNISREFNNRSFVPRGKSTKRTFSARVFSRGGFSTTGRFICARYGSALCVTLDDRGHSTSAQRLRVPRALAPRTPHDAEFRGLRKTPTFSSVEHYATPRIPVSSESLGTYGEKNEGRKKVPRHGQREISSSL